MNKNNPLDKSFLKALLKKYLPFKDIAINQNQVDRLADYLFWLNRWNPVHNLTAIRDLSQQINRHILDSLAVLPFLPKNINNLADIGSGAGLPGVILAIMLPDVNVFLVEAQKKKCAFLWQVKIKLGLNNVTVIEKRAEHWNHQVDLLITRATMSTVDFLHLTEHLAHKNSTWLLMKGKKIIEDLPGFSAIYYSIDFSWIANERNVLLVHREK